jgi:pimeloyl-ACP methyl ester carboxylesterase
MRELPIERHAVRTADGWTLSLGRVPPALEVEPADAPPVMLLHGLGSNRHSMDLAERSLARWLAARGHDVWLPDLRGHGESAPEHYRWRFEDYLREDLPRLLDAIMSRTGAHEVDWVGHSMGGILLMAYASLEPEAPIGRGVTIASALDYARGDSGFQALARLQPALERGPLEVVRFGALTHALAPLVGRARVAERFHMWPPNIEPRVARRVFARCFGPIPTSLASSLAGAITPEGLRLSDGTRLLDHASALSVPLLALAGTRDAQVSVESVRHAASLIGDNVTFEVFGRAHGHAQDYGHFDLVVGKNAPDEVWPRILGFLTR